jgi:hypothetical protein
LFLSIHFLVRHKDSTAQNRIKAKSHMRNSHKSRDGCTLVH